MQQVHARRSTDRLFTFRNLLALAWAILALAAGLVLATYGLVQLVQGVQAPADPAQGTNFSQSIAGVLLLSAGLVVTIRYVRLMLDLLRYHDYRRARDTMRIDLIQVFLLTILATVLFPVVWILSMSFDPRDISRPQGLSIIPPGATLDSYIKVLTKPSANPVSFWQLLVNSLLVSGGTAFLSVAIGTSAAYAFSRFSFPGRRIGMLGFVLVLMIPAGATLAPLFVLLNALHLRTTLWGLAIAYTSSALPFAIWNMKGFIDSLPYDLEEAAQIDGAGRTMAFLQVILPLAAPGMVVTALWGFLTGWSEFILAWTFLTDPGNFTLPMVLRGMTGQYASGTPWSEFAAMSVLMSIPPILIFFLMQRYLVSGLAVGGVKG
jgi:arabinogalactan oligomer/maltooligosaccharide transport system permease protein